MLVRLAWPAFVGINLGRWPLYTQTAGLVDRVVNSIRQDGRASPSMMFEIDPAISLDIFLQRFPEAREVSAIMADASISNPNIITEPQPNATAFTVAVVTITTAGTPVQLSSIVVPDGRALVVASNALNDPKKHVFVANSSANALSATTRVTLSPGNSVKLYVTNANQVWVDTDLNGQKVDVIVEQ